MKPSQTARGNIWGNNPQIWLAAAATGCGISAASNETPASGLLAPPAWALSGVIQFPGGGPPANPGANAPSLAMAANYTKRDSRRADTAQSIEEWVALGAVPPRSLWQPPAVCCVCGGPATVGGEQISRRAILLRSRSAGEPAMTPKRDKPAKGVRLRRCCATTVRTAIRDRRR